MPPVRFLVSAIYRVVILLAVLPAISLADDRACLNCHKAVDKGTHNDLGCAACHTDHGANPAKVANHYLSEASPKLCLTCHSEKLDKEFVHEPARANCSICHNPHAATPKNLRADANAVCLECHATANAAKFEADAPVKLFNGQVTLPPRPFQNLRLVELKDGRSHPVSNHPVDRCATCHSPHGANNSPVFLVTEMATFVPLCQRCHQ